MSINPGGGMRGASPMNKVPPANGCRQPPAVADQRVLRLLISSVIRLISSRDRRMARSEAP